MSLKPAILPLLSLVLVGWLHAPLQAQFRGPRGEDAEAARQGWLFSLAEGKAQARQSGRPLMVVIRCVP